MCGRFSLGADASTLASQFNLFEAPVWTPRNNIAPTQEFLAVMGDPTTASRQTQQEIASSVTLLRRRHDLARHLL